MGFDARRVVSELGDRVLWRSLYKVQFLIILFSEVAAHMWFLSRSCMQYLYLSQFYLLSPWNKASNIHSIINVLCALWGVLVLLVSLRHSVSHLWRMPEKGCSSNCGLLIASWLPQCCLWNCTIASFVSISSPSLCQQWNHMSKGENRPWIQFWRVAGRKDTYGMRVYATSTCKGHVCVFITLKQQHLCYIVAVGMWTHLLL